MESVRHSIVSSADQWDCCALAFTRRDCLVVIFKLQNLWLTRGCSDSK